MNLQGKRRKTMKKLTVVLMVVSLMLTGVGLAAAGTQPQALKGVDMKSAQKVTDTQAQTVRGAAQGQGNLTPGTCISTTTTCLPIAHDYGETGTFKNQNFTPGPYGR
jgi:hypothetical protein